MHSCGSVKARVQSGSAPGLAPGLAPALAIAAALAFLVSGCSPEIGFPAIHDMPPPRADTPLTPDQVKQATDNLISERDHLSTEAPAGAPATVKKVSLPAPSPPPPQASAPAPTADAAQTAGADAKP